MVRTLRKTIGRAMKYVWQLVGQAIFLLRSMVGQVQSKKYKVSEMTRDRIDKKRSRILDLNCKENARVYVRDNKKSIWIRGHGCKKLDRIRGHSCKVNGRTRVQL